MIVEDNKGTNKAICEYMKTAGHTLISAYDGVEALKHFREDKLGTLFRTVLLQLLRSKALILFPNKSMENGLVPKVFLFTFSMMLMITLFAHGLIFYIAPTQNMLILHLGR